MDNTEAASAREQFETQMQDFFSKANAKVLKLGSDYTFSQYEPNYIILDTQRKSFYYAEVDLSIDSYIAEISSNSASVDETFSKMIDKFAEDKEIDKNLAFSLLSLGRAFKELPASHFSFPDTDLTIFNRKLSLIVQEPRSVDVIGALNEFGFSHQAVPSKDLKAIFFDDKSAKLVEANYLEYYNQFAPTKEEEAEEKSEDNQNADDGEIKPVFTPTGDGQPKDPNSPQAEAPSTEPQKKAEEAELDETPLNDDEKQMIENINLDDLIKPSEEDKLPEDEIEANKLLSKSINEQVLANTTNVEIASRDISEVPLDILSPSDLNGDEEPVLEAENDEKENKELSKQDLKAQKLAEKQAAKKAKEQAKLEAKKAKEAKKAIALSMQQENSAANDENTLISLPSRIMDNVVGFIFFFPLYLFYKAFKDMVPAFMYYWFFSILTILFAFFGGFEAIASFIPTKLTDWNSLNLVNTLDTISDTLKTFPEATSDIISITDNLINEAKIVIESEKLSFEAFRGALFQIMVPFGSLITLIPAFRFMGKVVIIFSILAYSLIGIIPYIQSKFLLYAVRNTEDLAFFPGMVNVGVHYIPLIFLLILLAVSVAIVPDKAKRIRRVLP